MDDVWQIVIVAFFVGVGQTSGTELAKYAARRVREHSLVRKVAKAAGM